MWRALDVGDGDPRLNVPGDVSHAVVAHDVREELPPLESLDHRAAPCNLTGRAVTLAEELEQVHGDGPRDGRLRDRDSSHES